MLQKRVPRPLTDAEYAALAVANGAAVDVLDDSNGGEAIELVQRAGSLEV